LRRSLRSELRTDPVAGVTLSFEQDESPWHTVCRAEADNRFGLLAALAFVFASVGANVHSADVATVGGVAVDVFELTGPTGGKLSAEAAEAAAEALATGVLARKRRLGRGWVLRSVTRP
jgi:UTP:GlnB (protein PII) uridylyltransferase